MRRIQGCVGILISLVFTGWLFWDDILHAQVEPGAIQFVEITPASGLTLTGNRAGVAVSDFDADGREDLTFSVCSPDLFYRNVDGTAFGDVTATWTSQLSGNPIPCNVAPYYGDFDNDGDQDVLVGVQGIAALWRNELVPAGQSAFTQVATFTGSGLPTVASWIDVDNDGDLDLFIGFANNQTLLVNRLVETGSPVFEDVTSTAGLALTTDASQQPLSAQCGNDGHGERHVHVCRHERRWKHIAFGHRQA